MLPRYHRCFRSRHFSHCMCSLILRWVKCLRNDSTGAHIICKHLFWPCPTMATVALMTDLVLTSMKDGPKLLSNHIHIPIPTLIEIQRWPMGLSMNLIHDFLSSAGKKYRIGSDYNSLTVTQAELIDWMYRIWDSLSLWCPSLDVRDRNRSSKKRGRRRRYSCHLPVVNRFLVLYMYLPSSTIAKLSLYIISITIHSTPMTRIHISTQI